MVVRMQNFTLLFLLYHSFVTASEIPFGWGGSAQRVYADAIPPLSWNTVTGRGVRWFCPIAPALRGTGGFSVYGNSDPVQVADRVFLTAEPDRVLCFELTTGRMLWEKYVSLPDDPPKPRQTVVREHLGYCTPTPVTDGTRLWCVFGFGLVVCFNTDGSERWRSRFTPPTGELEGVRISPVLIGDTLFTGDASDALLIAWNAHDGKRLWQLSRPTDIAAGGQHGSPRFIAERNALELPNGAIVSLSEQKIIAGDVKQLPDDPRHVLRTDRSLFRPLATELSGFEELRSIPASSWSSPVLAGEHLFIFGGGRSGRVFIFPLSGKPPVDRPHTFLSQELYGEPIPVFVHTPVFRDTRMFMRDVRGLWCIDRMLLPGNMDSRIENILDKVPLQHRVAWLHYKKIEEQPQHESILASTQKLLAIEDVALQDQVLIALAEIHARDAAVLERCLPYLGDRLQPAVRDAARYLFRTTAGSNKLETEVRKRFEQATGEIKAQWLQGYALVLGRDLQKELTSLIPLPAELHPAIASILAENRMGIGKFFTKDPKDQSTSAQDPTRRWLSVAKEMAYVQGDFSRDQNKELLATLTSLQGHQDIAIAKMAIEVNFLFQRNLSESFRTWNGEAPQLLRVLSELSAQAARKALRRLSQIGAIKELRQISADNTFSPWLRWQATQELLHFPKVSDKL